MIFDLTRRDVGDSEVWKLVCRANNLTQGDHTTWIKNGDTMIKLLEKTMLLAKEKQELIVYFYATELLLYLLNRDELNDLKKALRIAELYRQSYIEYEAQLMAQRNAAGQSHSGHLSLICIKLVIELYAKFPQINDEKISQLVDIFIENANRFGDDTNRYMYQSLLSLALINQDIALADMVKRELDSVDYSYVCYLCYYVRPAMQYYILTDDYESMNQLISDVIERRIPLRYLDSYESCESKSERIFTSYALDICLKAGKSGQFKKLFSERGRQVFVPGEEMETEEYVFHDLIGDDTFMEDSIKQALTDNHSRQQHKAAPLVSLYHALYWYCYFHRLDQRGVSFIEFDIEDPEFIKMDDGRCTARMAADYFERQADLLGAKMMESRARYRYETVKQTFETCLIQWDAADGGTANE